jgi:hypothetical protein
MITKRKVAEAAARVVNGGSTKPELKVKIQDAMLAAGQARDSYLMQLFSANNDQGNFTFPFDVLSTFELTVQDGKVVLPRRVLSILKHNSGIYRVATSDCEEQQELIPTRRGSNTLYSGQLSRNLEGRPSYYPLRDTLYVQGVGDGCKLEIDAVISGEEFTADEFFALPPEAENDVINMAIQRLAMMMQSPEDMLTDSKANQ